MFYSQHSSQKNPLQKQAWSCHWKHASGLPLYLGLKPQAFRWLMIPYMVRPATPFNSLNSSFTMPVKDGSYSFLECWSPWDFLHTPCQLFGALALEIPSFWSALPSDIYVANSLTSTVLLKCYLLNKAHSDHSSFHLPPFTAILPCPSSISLSPIFTFSFIFIEYLLLLYNRIYLFVDLIVYNLFSSLESNSKKVRDFCFACWHFILQFPEECLLHNKTFKKKIC